MRIWEFNDKKETPSDLVREQDFVMRVRHMQRSGTPCLILNFVLTAIDSLVAQAPAMESAQKKLKEHAQSTRGTYFEMSNGDVFIAWENPGEARLVANRAIDAALFDCKANANKFLLPFRLPENYVLLRERMNAYVEDVRTRAAANVVAEKVDETGGRLTAKNVEQIERILVETDVRRYGRSQNIYTDAKTGWMQVAEEYFFSFEELRRENFPKLDVAGAGHFFFAICAMLDQKLLAAITTSYNTIAGRTINMNLSIDSVMESVFTQFVRSVPKDRRNLIGFELHCGDLFYDLSMTLDAITLLRREGFRVSVDGMAPNMAAYIDFGKLPVDWIKVKSNKDSVPDLKDPAIRKELEKIPAHKLIFYRCDTEQALAVGRDMGVGMYQGWLIDDLVAKGKKSP